MALPRKAEPAHGPGAVRRRLIRSELDVPRRVTRNVGIINENL